MTQIPPFAPGCFGSALAYAENSFCRACVFREQCEPMHKQNLTALRARFGIDTNPRKRANVLDGADGLALPKKTQELVNRLDYGNLRITEKLAAGENPFETGLAFMKIACHLLLRLGRPFDRGTLSAAFAHKLNWKDGTADSHARMAIQALVHIGAVDLNDGYISLRKAG